MANTTVKGITVEFAGNTTKLDKALREVRNTAKDLDKELSQVNKALKFNPGNATLLAQKQTVLKEKIEATAKSLDDLKDMQKQLDAQGVDENSEAYRELQREIITTESKLKHYKSELAKVNAQTSGIYKLGEAFEKTGKKIENAGRKLAPVSKAAAAVAGALGTITYKAGKAADDLNTLSKQTGISTKDLQLYAAAADLTDVSVEAMAKTHQKLKKNMLGAMDGTNEQAQYFEQLGIDITNADGSLRDANEVFDETIAALGKMENETERDAIAMAIFGKSANELNPIIEDGGATYAKVAKLMEEHGLEPVDQEALDKANEFNDQIDTIKLMFAQAVQIIGTKIAGTLLPAMKKVTEYAGKLAEKLSKLSGKNLTKILGLSSALAGLAPVLIGVAKVMQIFGGKLKAVAEPVAKLALKFPKLGKALRFFTNPITLVVAALAGLGLAIGKSGKSADELVKAFDEMVKKAVAKIGELIPQVVKILKDIGATIIKNAPVILKGISTLLQAVLQALIKYGPTLLQGAVKLFTSIVQSIPVVLPKLLQAITGLVKSVITLLPTLIPLLLKAAVNLFMSIVKAIPQVVASLVKALPQIGSAMLSYFRGLLKSLKGVFSGIGKWFGEKFAGAWKAIKEKFAGWGEFWGGLWTKIKKKFGEIGTNIHTAISDSIKTGLNKLLSSLEEKLNHVVVTVNRIIKFVNDHSPLNIGTLGAVQLPRLAKGGVLNGAQMVVAGEAGPEAIIPLDRLFGQMDKMAAQIAATAGGPVINVYGAAGQSVHDLAREVARVLIADEKRRTQAWA